MTNEIEKAFGNISPFERIRRINETGNEYWSSRDFAQVLGYTDYRNFEQVIQKARISCFNSGQRIEDHFVDVTDMVPIGSGTMPENLPVAEDIKKLEPKHQKREVKKVSDTLAGHPSGIRQK